jgi:hypothetical protein
MRKVCLLEGHRSFAHNHTESPRVATRLAKYVEARTLDTAVCLLRLQSHFPSSRNNRVPYRTADCNRLEGNQTSSG